jgi:hypothetical protein
MNQSIDRSIVIPSLFVSSIQKGNLPTELGLLTNLKVLSMSNSPGLTGPIPTQLGKIKGLLQLVLEANALTGSIPDEITTFNRLTLLDLAMNEGLVRTIPCTHVREEEGRLCTVCAFVRFTYA